MFLLKITILELNIQKMTLLFPWNGFCYCNKILSCRLLSKKPFYEDV